ncbi:hypothetical protein [Amycolatopsis rubida]|uniref:Uncharacterized protein n=1 Tax=Amycolatopsis rubida TaxID=112413 RepID=A0A1I5XAP4_9PSEU|nr:hypothetical protein [Amycolatopsis rubida]SFQ29045.1 hypothetical protein SAMN05421854_110128 [Amycolatopsis rubida]
MTAPYGGVPQYGHQPHHQFGPQHFGPQHFGPQQFGPQQFGPQQFGPQQFGPQQFRQHPGGRAAPPPTPPRKKRWLWLVPTLVIVLAAAIAVPSLLGSGDAPNGGTQPEQHTPAPAGRDTAAVTAALRAIDPCALADTAGARKRGTPDATAFAIGPHACVLAASPRYVSADAGVTVRVGALSDQLQRYAGTPTVLAGAKAYQYSAPGDRPTCRLVLPVSFELAVEVSYTGPAGAGEACAVLRPYAEAAVAQLRHPASIPPANRPYAAWDGCTLLAAALRGDATKYEYQPLGADPLAGCATHPAGAPDPGPALELFYDTPTELSGQPRSIAGKTLGLKQLGDQCHAVWDDGPSGAQNRWVADVTVKVSARTCDAAAALAERVIGLAAAKPSGQAPPATELLYAPDDHDTNARGACVDLGVPFAMPDCEPYQPVALAPSPQQIMTDAARNRNVACAAFHDAVTAVYGSKFVPVTWGRHCFFVDSAHELAIRVNVTPEDAPGGYGQDAPDRRETVIAGKAAVVYTDDKKTTCDIYLSPTNDLQAPGNLHVQAKAGSGRGKYAPDPYPPLPQDGFAKAESIMAQTVEAHFR